jgi:hypothetical protein
MSSDISDNDPLRSIKSSHNAAALREPPDIVLSPLQAVKEPEELIAGVISGRFAMG